MTLDERLQEIESRACAATHIEKCECDWFEKYDGGVTDCGCGECQVRFYRDPCIVHYAGAHWREECLLKHLLSRTDVPALVSVVRRAVKTLDALGYSETIAAMNKILEDATDAS